MSQAFAPIKRRRLSDQVSAQIQVRIASGERSRVAASLER